MTGRKIDINKLEDRLRDIPKWRETLISASYGNPNKYIPPLPTFFQPSTVSETSTVSQIFSTLTVSETSTEPNNNTKEKPTRKKQLKIHSMLQPMNKMPQRPRQRNFVREQQYQQWQMQQIAMQQDKQKNPNVSETEQKHNVPVQIYHTVSQTNQNQQQSQFVTFEPTTHHLQQHVSQTASSPSTVPSLSQRNYYDYQQYQPPPQQQQQQIHPMTQSKEQSNLSSSSSLLQRQKHYSKQVDALKRQIQQLEYQKTKEGAQALYAHYNPQTRVSNQINNNESNKNRKRRDVHLSPSDNPHMRAAGNKTHRRRKNGLLYLHLSSNNVSRNIFIK